MEECSVVSYHTASLSDNVVWLCVSSRVLFFLCCFYVVALSQEYTLAHIDKPDTLAGAEKALKKHEDFVSTMEANEDKIDGALQGGQRLVDSNNLYSGKVQEKMESIRDRSVVNMISIKCRQKGW